MKKLVVVIGVTLLVFGVVGQANATLIAYNLPDETLGNQSWTGSLGLDFNVNQTIEVTALGVFDALYPVDGPRGSGEGLVGPLTVKLFDLSNTAMPLAQKVFQAGTPGTNAAFIFSDLSTALFLPVGSYSIVAFGSNGDDQNYNT
jgi:hypothetical protein